MQTLRPSQVPEYLRTSSFFLGLNVVDDDEFSIPVNHMKSTISVNSLDDMTELLNTIRFWGVDIFPQTMVDFAARQSSAEIESILESYRADLPLLTTVCTIAAKVVQCKTRLEKAMESGNLNVVHYFHKKGMSFTTRAIALAAGKGALDCLQYALTIPGVHHYDHFRSVFPEAVRNGCMDCIYFLQLKGFPLRTYNSRGEINNLVDIAASSGQCDVLKYLHRWGCSVKSAAIAAADAGHFDCLEYAMQNGALLRGESGYATGSLTQRLARAELFGFFQLALSRGSKVDTQTALVFAKSGNLKYLQLCIEHGARPSITLVAAAAQEGHLTCLQYLHQFLATQEEELEPSCDVSWISYAASIGKSKLRPTQVAQSVAEAHQWECLQFLITHGCPMHKSLTTQLVRAGQLELYRLATMQGCGVSVQAACTFAANGNINLLQHALEHGCERSEEILRVAARHGQLQCLMHAHAQGCPWSAQVTLAAARGGHQECLQYLHEHRCPWDARVRSAGHKQCILDYADAHKCPLEA